MLPQKPYWLQQFPKVEPIQVIVVPQEPSVLIACDAEDVELVLEVVEVAGLEVDDAVTVEDLVLVDDLALDVLVDLTLELVVAFEEVEVLLELVETAVDLLDDELEPGQEPPTGLQPVPQ